MQFNLWDNIFSHEKAITAGQTPAFFEWNPVLRTGNIIKGVPNFYSHDMMFGVVNTPPETSFGLLFESYGIMPGFYKNAHQVMHRFNKIFTYNKRLIDTYPDKFLFIPAYGSWIGTPKGGGTFGICDKAKGVSMIASNKQMTPLQIQRCNLAKFLNDNKLADVFGNSVGNSLELSYDGLAPYRFSFVVENIALENYFTEKLLNCFAVGTVPVYLGCRNITDFFNPLGIVNLNNILTNVSYDDMEGVLEKTIAGLTERIYNHMLPAIQDNFKKLIQLYSVEDYLYTQYYELLPGVIPRV